VATCESMAGAGRRRIGMGAEALDAEGSMAPTTTRRSRRAHLGRRMHGRRRQRPSGRRRRVGAESNGGQSWGRTFPHRPSTTRRDGRTHRSCPTGWIVHPCRRSSRSVRPAARGCPGAVASRRHRGRLRVARPESTSGRRLVLGRSRTRDRVAPRGSPSPCRQHGRVHGGGVGTDRHIGVAAGASSIPVSGAMPMMRIVSPCTASVDVTLPCRRPKRCPGRERKRA